MAYKDMGGGQRQPVGLGGHPNAPSMSGAINGTGQGGFQGFNGAMLPAAYQQMLAQRMGQMRPQIPPPAQPQQKYPMFMQAPGQQLNSGLPGYGTFRPGYQFIGPGGQFR